MTSQNEYSGTLIDGLVETVKAAELHPPCTCDFWKHKVHDQTCARRIATQEKSNEAAMAQFNVGARSSRLEPESEMEMERRR